MANLPEKNITQVDEITSVPANSKLFVNANGEFRQATVNEVVKSSTVVTSAVENAINTAVEDGVNSHFKQTTGSPILLTDSADGTLIDFKAYGRSTQDGEPTPDNPIAIKSVADGGYFDGELLQGYYNESGVISSNSSYVCSKNLIPCNSGDNVKLAYAGKIGSIAFNFYDKDMNVLSRPSNTSEVTEYEAIAPTNAKYVHFMFREVSETITPQTSKHITVTINGKYAFIEKSKGKNKLDITKYKKIGNETVVINDNTVTIKAGTYSYGIQFSNADVGLEVGCEYRCSSLTSGVTIQGGWRLAFKDGTYGNALGSNVTITISKEVESILYYIGSPYNGTTDITISEMQIEVGAVATDYEPYKEEVKYIPLNEPLRGVGDVRDEVSLNEINRKFAEVVFDGSSDERWLLSSNCFYINLSDTNIDTSGYCKALCTHFKNHNVWLDIDGSKVDNSFTIYRYKDWVNARLAFYTSKIKTGAEWTEWLQANPITVIYELAEPIVETIEPVDIVTYDNVTYLTASDDADMELEYPTSKVAGIASIGYSKGRKAEYEVELLKAQLLELQTAMVNSL